MCTVKLERAEKLISGLGGEKARWTAAARSLGEQYIKLTGDVLLAAGQIAYLGPFTAAYRADVLRDWVTSCQAKGIPCGDRFKLGAVLGDPVKVGGGAGWRADCVWTAVWACLQGAMCVLVVVMWAETLGL